MQGVHCANGNAEGVAVGPSGFEPETSSLSGMIARLLPLQRYEDIRCATGNIISHCFALLLAISQPLVDATWTRVTPAGVRESNPEFADPWSDELATASVARYRSGVDRRDVPDMAPQATGQGTTGIADPRDMAALSPTIPLHEGHRTPPVDRGLHGRSC